MLFTFQKVPGTLTEKEASSDLSLVESPHVLDQNQNQNNFANSKFDIPPHCSLPELLDLAFNFNSKNCLTSAHSSSLVPRRCGSVDYVPGNALRTIERELDVPPKPRHFIEAQREKEKVIFDGKTVDDMLHLSDEQKLQAFPKLVQELSKVKTNLKICQDHAQDLRQYAHRWKHVAMVRKQQKKRGLPIAHCPRERKRMRKEFR